MVLLKSGKFSPFFINNSKAAAALFKITFGLDKYLNFLKIFSTSFSLLTSKSCVKFTIRSELFFNGLI